MNARRPVLEALRRRARDIERALELLLPGPAAYPAAIHEAMRYSALGGGKRLRGVLVSEAAALGGERNGTAMDAGDGTPSAVELTPETMRAVGAVGAAGAAVEMIHAYSLVHDDLPCMDDDDFRRGKPTNHKVFGEGLAVLAGDALLTRALDVITRLPWIGVTPDTTVRIMTELTTAAGTSGLIGGQVADLEAEGALAKSQVTLCSTANAGASSKSGAEGYATEGGSDNPSSADVLNFIHGHKTGALFKASLRTGGLLGTLDEAEIGRVTRFAESFGVAFQIVDDILDIEGDTDSLGKSVGSDERKEKLTFPALYGVDRAREMAHSEVDRAKAELEPFGRSGQFLRDLTDFILARKS